MYSSLFADINGEPEQIMINKFKKELKQAYYKDFKNMVCNSSVNKLLEDDKKNTISYRIMFEGKYLFVLSYVNEDCNK